MAISSSCEYLAARPVSRDVVKLKILTLILFGRYRACHCPRSRAAGLDSRKWRTALRLEVLFALVGGEIARYATAGQAE